MYRTFLRTHDSGIAIASPTPVSAFGRIKKTLARILVPLDGSHASLAGVDYLVDHGPAERTEIHLLNVQPPITAGDVTALVTARMVYAARRSAGEAALRAARLRLDREDAEYTAQVLFGPVAATILRYAMEQRCTQIVMGIGRKGRLARFIHGSVSGEVIRLAHTPVTLVSPNGAHRSTVRPRYAAVRQPGAPAPALAHAFAMKPVAPERRSRGALKGGCARE